MIEPLLPPGVRHAEAFDDHRSVPLYPEEAAQVANSVARRRAEFGTGRWCARQALAGLGLPPGPLPSGPRGEPRWPHGVVGTITHCEGYRAALVARSGDLLTLGMDAEPHDRLPAGVLDSIALPGEQRWVERLGGELPLVHWDRLLFSAKESVFKAWYPLTGRSLGFDEAEITVDPRRAVFRARLLVPGPVAAGRTVSGFTGRWLVGRGLVLTAIAELRPVGLLPTVPRPAAAHTA
ncbi:4'-phosphopantetheinyl transferase [Streptacidiphilus sp. EB129]|uniref:4'-phosphopantetheinyl transferase family protein n=1 Tax=Streptacidiphilus sp. EB129 TaxID=3156262 RepID=UPI00351739AB